MMRQEKTGRLETAETVAGGSQAIRLYSFGEEERTIGWLKGLRRMRVRYDRLKVIQEPGIRSPRPSFASVSHTKAKLCEHTERRGFVRASKHQAAESGHGSALPSCLGQLADTAIGAPRASERLSKNAPMVACVPRKWHGRAVPRRSTTILRFSSRLGLVPNTWTQARRPTLAKESLGRRRKDGGQSNPQTSESRACFRCGGVRK